MKFSALTGTVSSLLTSAYTCITHSLAILGISVIPKESYAPSQSISPPHPLPKQPLIQFLLPEINFAYSRTLYKLNHIECIFCVWLEVFEIHPWCVYFFFLLLRNIPLHGIHIRQFTSILLQMVIWQFAVFLAIGLTLLWASLYTAFSGYMVSFLLGIELLNQRVYVYLTF